MPWPRRRNVAKILLLGPARDAAGGVRHDTFDATTVRDVLEQATVRYGATFAEIVAVSQVWLNGETSSLDAFVGATDEVAILPPVSGG